MSHYHCKTKKLKLIMIRDSSRRCLKSMNKKLIAPNVHDGHLYMNSPVSFSMDFLFHLDTVYLV